MAIRIVEFFGYAPEDQSDAARQARKQLYCPFLGGDCLKLLSRDGAKLVSGVCTVRQSVVQDPIICCPIRLYDHSYQILLHIAERAFGNNVNLVTALDRGTLKEGFRNVVVFGKRWGKELRLPKKTQGGSYFVDWILCLVTPAGEPQDFLAIEVQSIDTTGNYREERASYLRNEGYERMSEGGINWENVSKRILPQIIYKGHVLRRERLCTKGMFFICPTPVYQRINQRLGGNLMEYPNLQPGSLTFRWYTVGSEVQPGRSRPLVFEGEFNTTIDQVALAFTSPSNLPPPNVYERAIRSELGA